MLKKLYDKSKILFAVVWIIAYCVLMSAGDIFSSAVGIEKSVTLVIGLLLSYVILDFLVKNKLLRNYGICRSKATASSVLWYLPVVLMLTGNLWFGVTFNYGAAETVLYILTMFCVGFLEEVIFRGFLFNAMRLDNPKTAVLVSSITFGFGHIINLINGSGADPLSSVFQVIYASAAGFMFVMLYCKTDSLVACILAHGLFNALSAFALEAKSVTAQTVSCALLTVITGTYALYVMLTMKRNGNRTV